jgi:hypothetical protein
MFNTIVVAGAVGPGAASRYDSRSDQNNAAPCGSSSGSTTLVCSIPVFLKSMPDNGFFGSNNVCSKKLVSPLLNLQRTLATAQNKK